MTDTLTNAQTIGLQMGWDDAARYATGTKQDRREIRTRLAKSETSYAPFWRSYSSMYCDRATAFAEAIREGRISRTIKPSKLFATVSRSYATA